VIALESKSAAASAESGFHWHTFPLKAVTISSWAVLSVAKSILVKLVGIA
jgi:hypothetical protein